MADLWRLVSYDPVQQIAQVADPDNEALQVSMSTTLLTQVKPFSADDIVALVGEVRVNSSGEMIFQPRVFAHTAPGMNYDLYRLMILNRRKHMREHGFTWSTFFAYKVADSLELPPFTLKAVRLV